MNVRRTLVVASLALGAWGCKKEQPPPAPARPAAAQAGTTRPGPPAREDFPTSESTLSVLEPANGRCEWIKLDPVANERFPVATFEGDCFGGKTALSRDGKRGALWLDPGASSPPGVEPRIFEVDVAAGSARRLPMPPAELEELGFDSKGRLLALSLQRPTAAEMQDGEVAVDGTTLRLDEGLGEGDPVVAHAFAIAGDGWRRVESKVSTEGVDHAPGIRELEAWKDLGYRSAEVLQARVQGDTENEPSMLDALRALAPQLGPTDGEWIRLGAGGRRILVWEASAEIPYSTGLIAFLEKGRPVKPPRSPFTENDAVAVRVNGPFLLIAQDGVGARPRLYREGEYAWGSDTARTVTFWPR